jgi:hypothetical protein
MYSLTGFSVDMPVGVLVNRKLLLGALAGVTLAAQAGAQAPAVPATEADKLEASAEHLARMQTSVQTLIGRIETARGEKDVVKLNCLNESLAQMKTLLGVAKQADTALREAMAKRDPRADSELSKVAVARTKVEGLRAGAEQCIKQVSYVVEERTTVEVQQPDLPGQQDGAQVGARGDRGPLPAPPPIVRPPPASRWY